MWYKTYDRHIAHASYTYNLYTGASGCGMHAQHSAQQGCTRWQLGLVLPLLCACVSLAAASVLGQSGPAACCHIVQPILKTHEARATPCSHHCAPAGNASYASSMQRRINYKTLAGSNKYGW